MFGCPGGITGAGSHPPRKCCCACHVEPSTPSIPRSLKEDLFAGIFWILFFIGFELMMFWH